MANPVPAVSGTITLSGTLTETNTSISGDVAISKSAKVSEAAKYTNGTGAGQVNLLYTAPFTITGATTLDLTALPDNVINNGASANFARVREFIVINQDANNPLKVFSAATNGWGSLPPTANALIAHPGNGVVYLSDRNSVGASAGMVVPNANKSVTFDPGTAPSITFNLVIAGCSATS